MLIKYTNIKSVLLMVLATTLFFTSCKENEAEVLFNDTPTERVEKREKELRDLLLSSAEGWKAVYFTDDENIGGYTFLFKFLDDTRVESASDFTTDINVVESLYDIGLNSTTTLTFTTKSKIHELSDSGNSAPLPSFQGSGFKGDFNFMYYGQENGEIVFRAARNFKEVRFVKATADDWADLQKAQDMKTFLAGASSHWAYKVGTEINNFTYTPNLRFASNSDNKTELSFGVGFTPTGIVVSPAISVNGKEYSNFTLNDTKDKLITSDGEFFMQLVVSPIDFSNFWLNQVSSNFYAQPFIDAFNVAKPIQDSAFGGNFPLSDIIRFGSSDPRMLFVIGRTTAEHNLNISGVLGEPNLLSIKKTSPARNWSFVPWLNPMVDIISDNSPYEVTQLSPTANRLVSQKDPDFWFIIVQ